MFQALMYIFLCSNSNLYGVLVFIVEYDLYGGGSYISLFYNQCNCTAQAAPDKWRKWCYLCSMLEVYSLKLQTLLLWIPIMSEKSAPIYFIDAISEWRKPMIHYNWCELQLIQQQQQTMFDGFHFLPKLPPTKLRQLLQDGLQNLSLWILIKKILTLLPYSLCHDY